MKSNRTRALIGALAVSGLVLSACSSDSTTSDSTSAESSTTEAEVAVNAGLVGFSYPIEANSYLKAIGSAAEVQLMQKCGAGFFPIDAQLDGNKQISDVEAMITKGVNAMIIYPLDSNGLNPVLEKASAAGIKVITMNSNVDDSLAAPPEPSLGQVQDAFSQRTLAQERVAWLKQMLPEGGNVLYVGLGFPVVALEAHANLFEEELATAPEFNFLGRVDNQTDDSEGGRQATDEALVRFPEVNAIVAYNDPTALGAYQAVSAAGLDGQVKIVGLQMQPEVVESIAAGKVDGSWDFDPVSSGISLANLTCDILTGSPAEAYSKTVQTPSKFYDATTIKDFTSWEDQIANIGK